MATYAPVPFSLYLSTTGKITQPQNKNNNKKKQNPTNPVLLNCTIEYLKKGNVNANFTIPKLTMFFPQTHPF